MSTGLDWFKLCSSLPRHRKALHLAGLLQRPRAHHYVVDLWMWAAEECPSGDLSGVSAFAIAGAAGWEGDALLFVNALRDAGFIDANGCLHDWEEKNPAHVRAAKRIAKKRSPGAIRQANYKARKKAAGDAGDARGDASGDASTVIGDAGDGWGDAADASGDAGDAVTVTREKREEREEKKIKNTHTARVSASDAPHAVAASTDEHHAPTSPTVDGSRQQTAAPCPAVPSSSVAPPAPSRPVAPSPEREAAADLMPAIRAEPARPAPNAPEVSTGSTAPESARPGAAIASARPAARQREPTTSPLFEDHKLVIADRERWTARYRELWADPGASLYPPDFGLFTAARARYGMDGPTGLLALLAALRSSPFGARQSPKGALNPNVLQTTRNEIAAPAPAPVRQRPLAANSGVGINDMHDALSRALAQQEVA